tara:strand:+ start:493 stop:981 length:489 start_codon:yes stop_codon:yes gene_type:complete
MVSQITKEVFLKLKEAEEILCTAESCTGGLISASITDMSGSSDVFDCAFITYSNEAKMKLVNVSSESLDYHGAVSQQVAEEMAKGALKQSPKATISIAVTGVAGPNGGSEEKPVGTVWFALAHGDKVISEKKLLDGDRDQVRKSTVYHALSMIVSELSSSES